MKVLFLSVGHGIDSTAYTHRLVKLRNALEKHHIQTEFLSLREQPVAGPIFAHPLNLPFIRNKVADYDFIHAGAYAAYTAAFLRPFTRAKIIYDVHGDIMGEAQLQWTVRHSLFNAYQVAQALVVDFVASRYVDCFLAVSKPMQQWLVDKKRTPAPRISLVRNGVDLELFKASSCKPDGKFTVCYAGGFDSWQAIDDLVCAFEQLPQDQVQLRIIGFRERHAALKSSIAERLGAKVDLVDRVTQKELVSMLAAAHILIIPRFRHRAVHVALPTKFGEYLALGKPAIVCDVDETAQMVREHHCGLVSEPGPQGLAETIRAAYRLTWTELEHMGQNARSLAEREFSWDVIGQKYAASLVEWSDGA